MKTSRENSPGRRSGRRPRLFISYRRRFDHGSARLLKERLTRAFGEGAVFRDVDDVAPGDDFPESISEAIETCDAFLPLISPGWLGVIADLRDPADFVRREIAAALARRVPLIPLLVGGARMPEPDDLPEGLRELASRQAVELSDTRWDYDVQRLIEVIRPLAAPEEDASHTPTDRPAPGVRFLGTRLGKAAPALLVAASLAAAAYVYHARDDDPPPREVDYAECMRLISVFRPHEARVEADAGVLPLVGVDEYELAAGAPPAGLPLLVRLGDSGQEVGAVSLRYFRGQSRNDWKFVVELAAEPPCVRVENYANASKPAYAHTLTDWDTLRVPLRGREYLLRVGDHGDSLTATLTRAPQQ